MPRQVSLPRLQDPLVDRAHGVLRSGLDVTAHPNYFQTDQKADDIFHGVGKVQSEFLCAGSFKLSMAVLRHETGASVLYVH